MASSSGAVLLVALGLVALGIANNGDGQTETNSTATVQSSSATEGGSSSSTTTCDGVVVVQTASATAEVPGSETASESTVECDMSEGNGDGAAVASMQQALVTCNGQNIAVDGDYGEQTRQAVAQVEEQNGLAVDGSFDPQVANAMQWPATSSSGETTCVSDVS